MLKHGLIQQSKCILKSFNVNFLNRQQLDPIFDVFSITYGVSWQPQCWEFGMGRLRGIRGSQQKPSTVSNRSPEETHPSGRIEWDIGQTRLLGFDLQGSSVCLVIVKETVRVQQVVSYLSMKFKFVKLSESSENIFNISVGFLGFAWKYSPSDEAFMNRSRGILLGFIGIKLFNHLWTNTIFFFTFGKTFLVNSTSNCRIWTCFM